MKQLIVRTKDKHAEGRVFKVNGIKYSIETQTVLGQDEQCEYVAVEIPPVYDLDKKVLT